MACLTAGRAIPASGRSTGEPSVFFHTAMTSSPLFLLSAVPFLLLIGCAPSQLHPEEPAPEGAIGLNEGDRIVFFGDSITQAGAEPGGYVTRINDTLQARYPGLGIEVIGAGISGNKVPDLLSRLDRDVISRNPTVVVIYIGINDVWHWFDFDAGTEKDVFEDGLEALVERIKAAGARVLLCTPSVIGEAPDFATEEDAMLDEYAGLTRAVAERTGVPVCDLRAAFKQALQTENPDRLVQGIFTTDRVHLNARGNAFVAEQILTEFYRGK